MKDLVDIMGGARGREPEPLSDERVQKSRMCELAVVMHYDTGKALFVSATGEEARAVWIPRSQVEVYDEGKTSPAIRKDGQRTTRPLICLVIPEWLAKEKGLV